ncbi:hypothetical protein ASE00_08725 [Sphingomonas sp. Root710]|nr:hypothetical protein ASE00_08725 [Sphingomonas sp. Root710]
MEHRMIVSPCLPRAAVRVDFTTQTMLSRQNPSLPCDVTIVNRTAQCNGFNFTSKVCKILKIIDGERGNDKAALITR